MASDLFAEAMPVERSRVISQLYRGNEEAKKNLTAGAADQTAIEMGIIGAKDKYEAALHSAIDKELAEIDVHPTPKV